ncbi:Ubiquitin-conjugating enzyme E2 6, partial [Coemansia biformis]
RAEEWRPVLKRAYIQLKGMPAPRNLSQKRVIEEELPKPFRVLTPFAPYTRYRTHRRLTIYVDKNNIVEDVEEDGARAHGIACIAPAADVAMASKAAFKRLTKEYMAMQSNPPPFITAKPLEANILEWHYVLRGPPETPYEGGEYHGRLKFPSDYPYKPPAIQMVTPSGRFQTNTNICMSMSNFHPDTWNPAWSVSTILSGMLSFMVDEEATTGSIRASTTDRKALARKSHKINLANKQFRELFPELCAPEAAPA